MLKSCSTTDYVDNILEVADKRPDKLVDSSPGSTKWKSIHQKLTDLYVEESKRKPRCKRLKSTSHLLAKLVRRESLNTLVVNLYPDNEGYTLMLRGRGIDSETIRLPYEESDLLEYIDNEELPPVLLDLLDKAQANIFYSGCVIVELRDYRRSTTGDYDTRYVLLKPTPHTLLCDINSLTNDGHRWTQEDKFNLEGQLLLHTNEPLCLDPDPAVFYVATKLNYQKQKFNNNILRRSVKKFSQAAVNRKRKMAQCSAPKHLRLHDFVTKKRDKVKTTPPVNLKVGKSCVDMWRQREPQLSPPESIDVDRYARILEKPKFSFDNTPVTVEEYTLETERSQNKVYLTRLTIQQRQSDGVHIGELYVDRDFVQNEQRGSICRFNLGSRNNVEKYIKQFQEIFTEEGRRSTKITHQVPGQRPTVTFTQNYPPTQHKDATATTTTTTTQPQSAQALVTQAQNLAATITGQSVGGDGKRPQPPIKLSLQINQGGLISPQGTPTQSPRDAQAQLTATPLAPGQVTLNLQQQQQLVAAHRARQMINAQRTSGTSSPASTPTGLLQPQLPTYTQATAMAAAAGSLPQTSSGASTPTPTPPPGNTPTTPRRASTQDGAHLAKALPGGTNVTLVQGQILNSAPATPTTPTSDTPEQPAANQNTATLSMTTNQAPNINITNIAGLQQNINIQNLAQLQGMGLASLQGLNNVQVSLSGSGNVPAGSIALPVPLNMLNSGGGLSQSLSHAGLIINQVPSGGQGAGLQAAPNQGQASSTSAGQPPTLVTMVTAIPASSTTSTTTSGSTSTVTAGNTAAGANMVQLPIGNLTHIMQAANLRNPQGLRQGAPLSLLQIPTGQLVNAGLAQARMPLTATPIQGGQKTTAVTTVLTGQPVTSQSLQSFPQLATSGVVRGTGSQLVQLAAAQSQPQLAQLALQQPGQQQIHLQPVKPPKSKKKRSSSTAKNS